MNSFHYLYRSNLQHISLRPIYKINKQTKPHIHHAFLLFDTNPILPLIFLFLQPNYNSSLFFNNFHICIMAVNTNQQSLHIIYYMSSPIDIYRFADTCKSSEETEVAGFIFKTFEILEVQQYQKIIYWAPNGIQFIIKDIVKLEELVLPKYFRHNKINSFVRQLNMYGFHKIKHNNFKSTFRHEYFQKNRADLLPMIKRKLKGNQKQQKENVDILEDIKIHQVKEEKSILKVKQQEPTMPQQKWVNMSQQFLATTKMINLSLIKVTCNELTEITNQIIQDDECASIEDNMEQQANEDEPMFSFQNPSCFFASQFEL